EGIGGGFATALFHGPLVGTAGGMRFNFIGGTEGDVDAPAVRLPSRNAGSVVLIGIGDAAVVLFLELVFDRVRRRVAAQPELLNELFALLVGAQTLPSSALFIRDDIRDVLVQPLAVRGLQLFAQLLFALSFLLFGERLGDGFATLRVGVRTFVLFFCITEVNDDKQTYG